MALTLGRKPGEKLYILDNQGQEIEIEIVKREEKRSNYTQLRINAPAEFNIIRGEIYEDSDSN